MGTFLFLRGDNWSSRPRQGTLQNRGRSWREMVVQSRSFPHKIDMGSIVYVGQNSPNVAERNHAATQQAHRVSLGRRTLRRKPILKQRVFQ